jgi:hypothetical protein
MATNRGGFSVRNLPDTISGSHAAWSAHEEEARPDHATTTLFAALNTTTGEVYHLCQQPHRHHEWLKFLRMIDQTVSADKQIHIICDNYGTHKHERV